MVIIPQAGMSIIAKTWRGGSPGPRVNQNFWSFKVTF